VSDVPSVAPAASGITAAQLQEAQHYAVEGNNTLVLPKDESGAALPSAQSAAFNRAWTDDDHDVDAVNALVHDVGAKQDNRQARIQKAKADQAKQGTWTHKMKRGGFKGGARAVGGVTGAAAGMAAASLPGAIVGGALGGAVAGGAAGAAWNAAEEGTNLAAAGRERELAAPASSWNKNGRAALTSSAVAKNTGKDTVVGAVTGALAPVTSLAGEAIGAAVGEGFAATTANATAASGLNAVSKEGTDLAMDKGLDLEGPSLKARAGNMVTGSILGGFTGGFDSADGLTAETSSEAAGEIAGDTGYGAGGEVFSGALELGGATTEDPQIKDLHGVAKTQLAEVRRQKREGTLRSRASDARAAVATRKANTEEHDAVLPPGRHEQGR
jgi:hypothetical protein